MPALLIPVAVHLLNKRRYKTVHWAAMQFLLKLQRASARKAKLMEMLLLATRILLVLAIVLAFSRPVSGGWLAKAISNDPECVVILLDRSSSMGARASIGGPSKLEIALKVIKDSASQRPAHRYVLIENVRRQCVELDDLRALETLELTAQTDTAANIPAMFQSTVEYLVQNKIGKSEIWIFSDLQASNWRVEDPSWKLISETISGLGFATGVYVMDLSSTNPANTSVASISADLRESDSSHSSRNADSPKISTPELQLAVKLAFTDNESQQQTLPIVLTVNGARSQTEVSIANQHQTHLLRIAYPSTKAGWGKCEIPADLMDGDNDAYFAWPEAKPAVATIIGESIAARRIQLACAPDVDSKQRSAVIIPAQFLSRLALEQTDLLVWADGAPSPEQGNWILEWLKSGGAFLAFAPAFDGASGLEGISWNRMETTEQTHFITSWDQNDGPLAKTEGGGSLPVHQLSVTIRQTPVTANTNHVVAAFSDGQSFLTRVACGRGQIYLAATRAMENWSSLHEGAVLVPLMQRLLMEGRSLREPPSNGITGEWSPDGDDVWMAEPDSIQRARGAKVKTRDPRCDRGVYRSGSRIIALNRPPVEDAPDRIQPTEIQSLLPTSQTHVFTDAPDSRSSAQASELWPMFMGLILALASVEAILSTNFTTARQKTIGGGHRPGSFDVSTFGKASS